MAFYQHAGDSGAHGGDASSGSGSGSGSEDLGFYACFGGVLQASAEERAPALRHCSDMIMHATQEDMQRRKGEAGPNTSPGCVTSGELLHAHVPHVLRLALACPLADVRESMRALLRDLAAIDPDRFSKYLMALEFAFRPSDFVPPSACVDPASHHGEAAECAEAQPADACRTCPLEEIFIATGRVSHVELLMAWHPSYLLAYTECSRHLMEAAGPLPPPWRCYLSLMAAARHQCDYLIALQETEFVLAGGDVAWLQGIGHAPRKLQALQELNALLAHQPWLITRSHIAALTAGSGGAGADSWSVAELVHALVILSTYHALCGFVGGMGLRMEIDAMDWDSWDPSKAPRPVPLLRKNTPAEATPAPAQAAPTPLAAAAPLPSPHVSSPPQPQPAVKPAGSDQAHLLHLLAHSRHLDVRAGNAGNAFDAAEDFSTSPANESNGRHAQRGATDAAAGESTTPGASSSTPTPSGATLGGLSNLLRPTYLDPSSPATKYLLVSASSASSAADAPSFPAAASSSPSPSASAAKLASLRYVNFDVNSKQYSTFFLTDYSWKEHGYALVHRYYQGFADMLDKEWDLIFHLTYNTVSDEKGVDTTPFRTAIWYYTHRLFGLQHDDYNYNAIPVFLTHALKTFVKKVVTAPETITRADFELSGYHFKPEEKAHVCLLAIEARRQASILYALHALMKFMGSD